MSNFHNVLRLLLALALALVAQSSLGQATVKLYSFDVTVDSVDANGTKLVAIVTNTTPPTELGNAQFSSVDMGVDLKWVVNANAPVSIVQSGGKSAGIPDFSVPGHLRVSNLYPVKPQEFVTISFYVTAASCGEGTWSVIARTGSNFSGDVFTPATSDPDVTPMTLVACGAGLPCDSSIYSVNYDNTIPVKRGKNSDGGDTGTLCSNVKFYLTDTLTTNHQLHLRWDLAGDDNRVFQYALPFKANAPQVAWLDDLGNLASGSERPPQYIPALSCYAPTTIPLPTTAEGYLPKSYGTLAAAVLAGDTKIKVTAAGTLPPPPFDFVIENERLRVTKIVLSTGTWTVTRNVFLTGAADHALGKNAMSTPLPMLDSATASSSPVYASSVGKPAKMCSVQIGTNNTSFIDSGDGWVIANQ
jgi:hypothetical protein